MSENETIADIVAELQRCGDKWIDDKTKTTMECLGLIAIHSARRIEAAWKREQAEVEAARTAENSSAVGNVDSKFDLCSDVESVLRIGRNFQKQDPWRGAHHDTAKLLCDTIEYLSERLSAQVGNAAAMREALLKCREIALQWQADEADGVAGTTDKPQARSAAEAVIDMEFEINAALSAPPRNCDVGTADEMRSRCGRYCRSHLCGKCEFGRETDDIDDEQSCIVRWMVSPYAEEGGEK